MTFLITCCAALTFAYAALMLIYRAGWKKQATFSASEKFKPHTRLSVIVPARNEAQNIAACIQSLIRQDYPKDLLEIIIVDDHSEDVTADVARREGGEQVKVISLKNFLTESGTNAFKKKALATGIAQSSGKLIITMDADCAAPRNWLNATAAFYETTQSAMIIGPVAFSNNGSLLQTFQSLDFTTMQGITAASARLKLGGMANGANLAFSRKAFDSVGGYEGTEHLASGDDYLLLQKMQAAFPEGIHYLKSSDAIVRTAPQHTWAAFLNQRVRWASKSGKYSDYRLTGILMLVYLFNLLLAGMFIAAFWLPQLWTVLAASLLIKILAELSLLVPVAHFYGKSKELLLFPLLQPQHIAYIVSAGFLGMKGGYRWKGRKVH